MYTITLTFLLLLKASSFNSSIPVARQQEGTQDSVKVWKLRAEAAAQEALMQKRLSEKMASTVIELKKKLEECQAKNKN